MNDVPQMNNGQFDAEVLQSPEPVLVDFYTDGCAPCWRLARTLEEIATERAGRLKVVKVDAGQEAELAAQFRVTTVPTLLLFRNGQCVAQRVGNADKAELEAWLDEI
jgi:thioredoxin 1